MLPIKYQYNESDRYASEAEYKYFQYNYFQKNEYDGDDDDEYRRAVSQRIVRLGQLSLEDLRKLPPGTILNFRHQSSAGRLGMFKFIRGKLIFIVDERGKPETHHLTDYGCLPYGDDNWNQHNWIELWPGVTTGAATAPVNDIKLYIAAI